MNTSSREFGRRLRDERERRGLMLQAIADSTKVPLALLAGLERGDIEQWPGGLFGRAHFRAYAAAVGLSPEPLLIEFLGLCGNDITPGPAIDTPTPDGGLRLTLAEERRWDFKSIGRRALAVALDLGGILTVTFILARALPANPSITCALVALTYYAVATMTLGQSVTLWWLGGRVVQRTVMSTADVNNVLLMPRRGLRDSRHQESLVDFGENPSGSVAQAASR